MRLFDRLKGVPLLLLFAVLVVATGFVVRGISQKKKNQVVIPTATVQRTDVTLTVEATGTVEPVNTVDVKSKASGQIIKMPVDIGSNVQEGDLLAQIDTRDVQNQYDQALAALKAAQAKVEVSGAQKKRSDDLFSQQIITAQEHESAVLDLANAQSSLVAARTNLDLAKQRLDDATVTAPISGTVIAKPVSVGQVISSATSSVSGGTTLLQMADLKQIRMRVLVNETDIGNVRPGQEATVVVDAYPQHPFRGAVEKIEPQAEVQQSVTMFPVLVSLSNEEGLLMPGMNGDVTVLVQTRQNVLAVPVDAVRSIREAATAATALGLDPARVRSELQAEVQQMRAGRGDSSLAGPGGGSPLIAARDGAGGGPGAGGAGTALGDTARAGRFGGAGRDSTRWRGRMGGGFAGGDSAGARRRMGRGQGGGSRGFGTGGGGGFATGGGFGGGGLAGGRGGAGNGGGTGGFGTGGFGGGYSAAGGANSSRTPRIVFVKTATGYEPRLVRAGLSDYDNTEILSGLKEGDEVVLLSAVELQQQRQESMDRLRQRMGGAMTGMQGGGTGGGRPGGGGGGGGGRPGGGGR